MKSVSGYANESIVAEKRNSSASSVALCFLFVRLSVFIFLEIPTSLKDFSFFLFHYHRYFFLNQ